MLDREELAVLESLLGILESRGVTRFQSGDLAIELREGARATVTTSPLIEDTPEAREERVKREHEEYERLLYASAD